jgi:hypothetical protein
MIGRHLMLQAQSIHGLRQLAIHLAHQTKFFKARNWPVAFLGLTVSCIIPMAIQCMKLNKQIRSSDRMA